MRHQTVLWAVAVMLVVGACGTGRSGADNGASGAGDGGGNVASSKGGGELDTDNPCGLVTAEVVASVFGGTSAKGEPGVARNCHFTIDGGVAPTVEVYHFGSADGWEGVRNGYVENRSGVTDVPGVGDGAYHPGDVGPLELVVRANGVIFAIGVLAGSGGADVEAAIVDLAMEMAG